MYNHFMSTASDADKRETEVSLAEAVDLFPKRNGKAVTVATLKRRIKVGCRGVRLFGFMSGACWYTTKEAIERFHAELTRREIGPSVDNNGPKRRESSRAAKDYLQRLGIGTGSARNKKQKRQASDKAAARQVPYAGMQGNAR